MKAEIITIGDEILIGQIIDTNSAFIAQQLNKIGVLVYQISSVQDNKQHILAALQEAESRADLVLITGGLGPTKDDITKHTLCEYFDDTLIQSDEALENVKEIFKKYTDKKLSQLNIDQALVPSKAKVLVNKMGTAPGIWLEKNNTIFVSMPGVPYEMKHLVNDYVVPTLVQRFKLPFILHKTIITFCVGESDLAEHIENWESQLPSHIKLAYLPNFGKVRLRLSGIHTDDVFLNDTMNEELLKLQQYLKNITFTFDDEGDIEMLIGEMLKNKKQTLATAESCTGGKIAELITSVAGASSYYKGGVVSYATTVKQEVLGIDKATIEQYSVVSAQVAEAMAINAKNILKTDYALATTGNAGPTKGDADAEIGTVFIAVASPKGVFSEEFNFGNSREKVVNRAVAKALQLLQKEILKN